MYCLPKAYKRKHDFCIHVYDQVTGLFKSIEESGALSVKIETKEVKELNIIKSLKGEELYKWLNQNGFNKEISELSYKQCFAAILSDMLQFLLTAFRCSEKGQLSVAYALLRKPLKDNLFYLEFLISEPEEFLKRFNDNKNVDVLSVDQCSKEEKIKIISTALKKINLPLYDGQSLYDLRYNKKNSIGFEPSFEQANHLITRHEYYRTSEGNLNFIFSNTSNKESQWQFLYLTMPQLMIYLLYLVTELSKKLIKLPDYWNILQLKYMLGLSYVMSNSFSSVKNSFKEVFEGINGTCDSCGSQILFDFQQFNYFQSKFGFRCNKCHKEYSLM